MKTYQKYSDKSLRPILQDIVTSCKNEGIDIFDPNSVNSNYGNVIEVVDNEIETYIGTPSNEDSSFFIATLLMNKNFMTEPIKRPELRTYIISHVFVRIETVRTTYKSNFDSYLPVTGSILTELNNLGYYEPTEGKIVDEEYVDSDYVDDWVYYIEEY